jgi:hypothetical protein
MQHRNLARSVAPRLAVTFAIGQVDVEHMDLVVARDDLAMRVDRNPRLALSAAAFTASEPT